ncbi:hypothetical protein [Actinacidiphila alni]|uniref:Uncharacterized protein n=1 Tax=Actinacidiphila alni TaxID=380248 RepID=A0A1I2DI84_9ACTN|nr:hypothetical protein [Actinacidiphila alni]SFE79650.1 hypothetical protein SAMN05216251_105232 [Actinacidiphila alni]
MPLPRESASRPAPPAPSATTAAAVLSSCAAAHAVSTPPREPSDARKARADHGTDTRAERPARP